MAEQPPNLEPTQRAPMPEGTFHHEAPGDERYWGASVDIDNVGGRLDITTGNHPMSGRISLSTTEHHKKAPWERKTEDQRRGVVALELDAASNDREASIKIPVVEVSLNDLERIVREARAREDELERSRPLHR